MWLLVNLASCYLFLRNLRSINCHKASFNKVQFHDGGTIFMYVGYGDFVTVSDMTRNSLFCTYTSQRALLLLIIK